MANKKIDIKYIAGFFEGEGSICKYITHKYNPMMKRRYPCTTIRVEIVNTDFNIIKKIFKYFKTGHLVEIKPRKKGYKPQLRWQTTHRQSYNILKQLFPYMYHKEKIKKARDIFRFYE